MGVFPESWLTTWKVALQHAEQTAAAQNYRGGERRILLNPS
jgi:hypothetical protein